MTLQYRLLALDVDGTLLDSRSELSAENKAALHEAHAAGLTVCLCTGRSLTETRTVIRQLGLDSDVGVFAFGGIISALPEGRTLHRSPIPEPLAARLVDHFHRQDYPVLVLYDVCEAGFDYQLVIGERNLAAYENWLRIFPSNCSRLSTWEPATCRPIRIGVIAAPDQIAETVAGLEAEFKPTEIKFNAIYAPNYRVHVVECFAPYVNKWHGITWVARHLDIEESRIAAIGDDVNDVEMIRSAGLGIAMGNAIEKVKAVAAWQVPTNEQAGVAVAVRAILSGDHPARAAARTADRQE